MNEQWNDAIISYVSIALYVPPGAGHRYHPDRPFHGFVVNGLERCERNYVFSDGFVLKTKPGDVFYLPKGSTYDVETVGRAGGCWAINFDTLMPLADAPFSVEVRNPGEFIALFKEADIAFMRGGEDKELTLRKILYTIIVKLRKELRKSYQPSLRLEQIRPALEQLDSNFTDNSMTVGALAEACGISQVYFRKIFQEQFGISPRQYIINRRLEYAKKLLQSGQLSVTEVAERCGFYEQCHFSRSFTKRFGVAPRNFIKDK